MIGKTEIDQLEQRAYDARFSMSEVYNRAGKHRQTWHRAKARGRINPKLYRELSDALAALVGERP